MMSSSPQVPVNGLRCISCVRKRGKTMVAGDDTPHSAVGNFAKNLRIISDIGRERKFRMPSA